MSTRQIVITSDNHFGDGTSQLAALDSGGSPALGPKYPEFREACGRNNDYLVMLGDVIDVAVEDYKCSQGFFQASSQRRNHEKNPLCPGKP